MRPHAATDLRHGFHHRVLRRSRGGPISIKPRRQGTTRDLGYEQHGAPLPLLLGVGVVQRHRGGDVETGKLAKTDELAMERRLTKDRVAQAPRDVVGLALEEHGPRAIIKR